jgi:hypothetical protein
VQRVDRSRSISSSEHTDKDLKKALGKDLIWLILELPPVDCGTTGKEAAASEDSFMILNRESFIVHD